MKVSGGKVIGVLGVLYLLSKGASTALAAFSIKDGVELADTPEVNRIRSAVNSVWSKYGFRPTITSSMDGLHMINSRHYEGLAEDYRTNDLPDSLKFAMADEVQNILGPNYWVRIRDFNLNNEHMHAEFDPV